MRFYKVLSMVVFSLGVLLSQSGCSTVPKEGPISLEQKELFATARSVYLQIVKNELPINIAHDAEIILKGIGLNLVDSLQKADVLVRIDVEGKGISQHYKDSFGFTRRYSAGSNIYGTILFVLKNEESFLRRFYGTATPPSQAASSVDIRPRYKEAYKNSNFRQQMLNIVNELYGKAREHQVVTAIQSDKKARKERARAIIDRVKKEQRDVNKDHTKKIKAYKIGILTEDQFLNEDWSMEKPVEGIIGIIEFYKQGGTNEYTLGYYIPPSTLNKGVQEDLLSMAKFLITKNNANFSPVFRGRIKLIVCKLKFVNNLLVSINWKQGADE